MSDDYVKFVNINIGRCTRKCYRESNSNRTESSGKNLVTNKDIQSSQREDLPLLLGIAQITPTPHPWTQFEQLFHFCFCPQNKKCQNHFKQRQRTNKELIETNSPLTIQNPLKLLK